MSEAPAPAERRSSLWPTLATGIGGAALAAVASTKDWARAAGSAAGLHTHAAATGSQSAPLAAALALVALAGWGVVLVSRGRARQAVAVLGLLASLGSLAATVAAVRQVRVDAAEALGGAVTGDVRLAGLTGWYWAAALGALLSAVAFAVAVRAARQWPAMGAKYDAPTGRVAPSPGEQDMWRALDEGHDPTA